MYRNILICSLFLVVLICCNVVGWAAVTMPSVLADHMVVQRNRPVHLWGMADHGEAVTVEFRGDSASTTANNLGQWSVYLPSGNAGGPFTLTVRAKNTIIWNDVLVGDIWVASGQSNMKFPLEKTEWSNGATNWRQEVAAANYPKLRLYHVEEKFADYPMPDVAAKTWTACTPQSAAEFSAVAYFFGRELIEKENIPIGLIEADFGGTPAEAWTSLNALSEDASLMPVFALRAHIMDIAANSGLPAPLYNAPAALYNAMIAPLVPLPIRGVIWYQGESNTDDERAPMYARLFPALIQDWRTHWAEGDFPFLFVQIANFNSSDGWAVVREAQRKTLSLANTGMAVTIDIGNPTNVHPTDKQDVGHRLALWARAISYRENIEDSGPLFRQAVPEGDNMRVWFDHAASGLVVKDHVLTGFEVAGVDKKFVAAQAKIDGDGVVASSTSVTKPMYVRYGWTGNPECTLYNHDGLPASPFSSTQ